MRRFLRTFGSCFLLLLTVGCTHKLTDKGADSANAPLEESGQDLAGEANSRPLDVAAATKGLSCPERMMCTREFRKTTCKSVAKGQEISADGSNPCEALNNLQQKFCDEKVAFDRASAACKDAG